VALAEGCLADFLGYPMQILTFTTLYPSASQPQHGIFVETRLRKLVESSQLGARVVAPCPWFPFGSARFGRYAVLARIPLAETRYELHIEHPRYPQLPKIGMSASALILSAAVLPLLRRQIHEGRDFDLIDAHYFYPDGVAAVLLGRALDRPVVITSRGSDLNIIAKHRIPRLWIRWAARHADGVVAVSSGLKQRLVELGVPAEGVQVLRNGVDLSLFRPGDRAAERRDLGVVRPTLLAVGNLVALKRHHLMIEALTQLPEVELLIVGDGPERAGIERLARERRVADRVRLLGRVPQDRLPSIYSAADLLLLVSTHEGWPNVLLESMACGTPVIVSDIAGIADIVGAPEAGRILSEAAPRYVADAVRDLLAAPPARAATRLYAAQFDWESTTQGQIALFREILQQRSKHDGIVRAA
jgi:teichuronic acid biosynthesis glycosyltransferase TuaC